MTNFDLCHRFGLANGQFFGVYQFKNLHWFLNGHKFGFGDLRSEDILRIQEELHEGEIFEGFNEHHHTRFMQRENPVVVIFHNDVKVPLPVPVSEKTRKNIKREGW